MTNKLSELRALLGDLRTSSESIQGEWDGDSSGRAEDRATIAGEIIECVDELSRLITYLYDDI